MNTTKAQKTLDSAREKVRAWDATVACPRCKGEGILLDEDGIECECDGGCEVGTIPNARRDALLEKLEVECWECPTWFDSNGTPCPICGRPGDQDYDGTIPRDLATMLDGWPASVQEAALLTYLRGVVEAAGWTLNTIIYDGIPRASVSDSNGVVLAEASAATELDAALDAVAQAFEVTL